MQNYVYIIYIYVAIATDEHESSKQFYNIMFSVQFSPNMAAELPPLWRKAKGKQACRFKEVPVRKNEKESTAGKRERKKLRKKIAKWFVKGRLLDNLLRGS